MRLPLLRLTSVPTLLASPAAGASPRRSMAWCSRSSSRRAATIPVIRPSSRISSGRRSSAPRPDGRSCSTAWGSLLLAQAIALEAHALKSSGASALRRGSQCRRGYALGAAFHRFKLKAGGFDARPMQRTSPPTPISASSTTAAHDARLLARLRRRAGGAARAPRTTSPIGASIRQKTAQITCLRPLDHRAGPRPFRRRRRGRLHYGRERAEGAAASEGVDGLSTEAHRGVDIRRPRPARARRDLLPCALWKSSIANPGTESVAARLTPMMAQYFEIKAANPDCLLFYRMGDFYELFFDDAEVASRALGIVLTKRGRHEGEDIRMCGVPIERADEYLNRLIALGHRVAVCEQLEDPAEAKKRGAKSVVRARRRAPGDAGHDHRGAPARARPRAGSSSRSSASAGARRASDLWLAALDLSTGAVFAQRGRRDEPRRRDRAARAERDRRGPGRLGRARLPTHRSRHARGRDAARARGGRRIGGRAEGVRILWRRDARRLRRLHAGRDRRRCACTGLRQAHPVRGAAGPFPSDAAGSWRLPRDRSRHTRQSRADPDAQRRARGLASRDDRPDRDARRSSADRRAAGEPAHRPGSDQRAARFARLPRGGPRPA